MAGQYSHIIVVLLAVLCAAAIVGGGTDALAFETMTAQEAYVAACVDNVIMVDVRTVEELFWVGSPACMPGGARVAYHVPYRYFDFDIYGNPIVPSPKNEFFVEHFTSLITGLGGNVNTQIILICRSGPRSKASALDLEAAGFTDLYLIDNARSLGFGGFQGPTYSNDYYGYRGYPGRLPMNGGYKKAKVQTDSSLLDPGDSVSWNDTGLPVTFNRSGLKCPVQICPAP